MNSLSWLLYLADVCAAVGDGLGLLAVFLSIALGFLFGVNCVLHSMDDDDDEVAGARRGTDRALKVVGPVAAVLVLLTLAAPEKETIYAIAASEMGEEVLKSKTVSKAHAALDAWLDKQIPSEAPDQPEKE